MAVKTNRRDTKPKSKPKHQHKQRSKSLYNRKKKSSQCKENKSSNKSRKNDKKKKNQSNSLFKAIASLPQTKQSQNKKQLKAMVSQDINKQHTCRKVVIMADRSEHSYIYPFILPKAKRGKKKSNVLKRARSWTDYRLPMQPRKLAKTLPKHLFNPKASKYSASSPITAFESKRSRARIRDTSRHKLPKDKRRKVTKDKADEYASRHKSPIAKDKRRNVNKSKVVEYESVQMHLVDTKPCVESIAKVSIRNTLAFKFIKLLKSKRELSERRFNALRKIYRLIDIDCSENVTFGEVVSFNVFLDPTRPLSDITNDAVLLFRLTDSNNNQLVSETEFLEGWIENANRNQSFAIVDWFIQQYETRMTKCEITTQNIKQMFSFTAFVLHRILCWRNRCKGNESR